MKEKIHKFYLNGMYILLDVNSGAVHVVDKMIFDIMDDFDGTNQAAVIRRLSGKYDASELIEAIGELSELIERKELFAPDIDAPLSFKQEPLVKSLCLHVAHDCNLRCKYCFAGAGDFGHDRSLMAKEVGEKAVEFIIAGSGARKHCEIDFFGGEPLLNMPVVRHVAEYVRRREKETGKEFKLTLTTNGALLGDENIRYLNDQRISLVLSLDGRKETHDAMRPNAAGRGSYDQALANFKKAVAARNHENYFLRGTFTAKNLDFAADVLDMNAQGFELLSVEPVVAKDADYAIEEEHLPRIFDEYEKLAKIFLERRAMGKGFFFFHFNVDLDNGPCVAKRLSGCGAGHEYFAVAPNGDLYPCHQFVGRERYLLGNLDDGVVNRELPKLFRASHVLAKPDCSGCWARFFCSGGCHANADLFHGDIQKPYEIGCALQKKRLECALMIQAAIAVREL